MTARVPVAERIARFTDASGGPDACWPWSGPVGNSGTATLLVEGRNTSVRRLVWELNRGPLLPTDMVMTACTLKQCMNPAHLWKDTTIPEAKFWTLVTKGGPGECWIWTGYFFESGYGGFKIAQKQRQAHRVSYEFAHGVSLVETQILMHTCDNPKCVNPAHLRLSTQKENMDDCRAKGRTHWQKARAAGVRTRRYSAEERARMREMRATGKSYWAIAREFGTNDATVSNICREHSSDSGGTAGGAE